MAKNEVKFRPATMAEIEGRDTDLYMDGERVWVLMIHRSETIGEGEPKLDFIMLTNMKKVQVEDLQVIDDAPEEPPMMKQWRELKEKHPDAILLFRCGDFYETYGSDATECVRILGITATQDAKRHVMAGFPHHALDTYLPKLVRAGKRVAICDQIQENRNNKKQETMAKNVKAADLIGKTIVNGNMKYVVIETIDDEKIKVEFTSGDRPAVTMPMPVAQVEKLLAGGWKFADGTTATETKASDDVEEVEDIKPEKPKAKTVKMDEPKGKQEKPKTEKPKVEKPNGKAEPKADSKLVYSTYQNKKGKTCAKIAGFKEDDAAYVNASDLHGSASYERVKDGKVFYLVFGPRYVAAAKEVCAALNAGKTMAACKAIVDKATEERAQQREEWKQKRAGKVYTEQEVVDLVERIIAGDKAAMDELNAMKKAA